MEHYAKLCKSMAEWSVPYSVHYPSKNSCVFTISESVNNDQLTMLSSLGASWHQPGGNLMILVADLGKELA